MKANNGTGNNESRDEWQTPQWLFDILNKQYKFNFDCCASLKNHKTMEFTTGFEDCYPANNSICWMNPPFSIAWEMFEHFFENIEKGVAIYRCDNFETKIWQEVIFPSATWIFIPNKRICYVGMEGKGSRFPSALIGYNVSKPIGLQGITLEVRMNQSKPDECLSVVTNRDVKERKVNPNSSGLRGLCL